MIQVYVVSMDREMSEEERSAAIECLTPERKAKALRFRRLKDQTRGILTGLLEAYGIRKLLTMNAGHHQADTNIPVMESIRDRGGSEKTEQYVIEKGSEGKPYIAGRPELHYNISHAGNLIVCGIGDEPLGIDVEREERYSRRVVERCFQPEEINDILSQKTEDEQKEVFAKYWVMKESFMKLSGAGFSVPIQTFHCNRLTGEILLTDRIPEQWMRILQDMGLQEHRRPICTFLPVEAGYQCSICVIRPTTIEEEAVVIVPHILTLADLLSIYKN